MGVRHDRASTRWHAGKRRSPRQAGPARRGPSQARSEPWHNRLQSDGLAVGDDRLVQPPGVGQGSAEVASHSRAVGPQRHGHGQETNGLFVLRRLAIAQRHPEVVVDPEVRRASLLGTAQERQGSGAGASLLQTPLPARTVLPAAAGRYRPRAPASPSPGGHFSRAQSARPGAKGQSLPGQAPA